VVNDSESALAEKPDVIETVALAMEEVPVSLMVRVEVIATGAVCA
jgi:hypothetical protein